MAHIWDDVISKEDQQVYNEAGLGGNSIGFGERPAVLIIDVQYRTVGDDKPILQSIRESGYSTSCGERAWRAVEKIKQIVDLARGKKFPVLYLLIERSDKQDAGRWADKIPAFGTGSVHRVGSKGVEVVEEVAPKEDDIIVKKRYPSAFFGTHLITQLNTLRVDTVIVTGCSTSGCVRATAVDAFSYGFRVIIPEDGVYDRIDITHKINLFDMNSKCADVIPTADILKAMSNL